MKTRALAWGRIVLLAGAAVLLLWAIAPATERSYTALLTLGELASRPVPTVLDFRPRANRQRLKYHSGGRTYLADLYRSRARSRAGMVLVHGAAHRGKDDPRLVSFATSLARAGFAVLVPDIADLRELRLRPESARDIADAFEYLRSKVDLLPGARAGIGTISVAVGPAMLAALEPDLAQRLDFLFALGPYFDLPGTLGFLTTGEYRHESGSVRTSPNEYGKWVFALSNATRLSGARDRAALATLARRKLTDPRSAVADLVAQLEDGGTAVYRLLTNTEPARVPVLLAALPAAIRADIATLNLAALDLRALPARLILVHGTDDNLIPYPESVRLAAAVGPGRAQLFLLQGLSHVDTQPAALDVWRMWRALYALLATRAG